MKNEKKEKKGFLAMLRESFTKTGGCCGPGETCCGPETKSTKEESKATKPTRKPSGT